MSVQLRSFSFRFAEQVFNSRLQLKQEINEMLLEACKMCIRDRNLVSREILSGLWVIRAFGTQKYEEKRFDGVNRDLTKTNLFVNRVMTCMMPAMMLTMNAVTVLIVWVGADKINAGGMQVGDLMAFIQYTMQIVMSFLMISMMSIMLPRATVSANRIQEVLETEVEIADPARPEGFVPSKTGEVEFQDVSFRYPGADEDVLENITFTAKKGETTAFIGSTGSGKSTQMCIRDRLYSGVPKRRALARGIGAFSLLSKADSSAGEESYGFIRRGASESGSVQGDFDRAGCHPAG